VPEQAPPVKVTGLRKTYAGGFAAVDGLGLKIPDGRSSVCSDRMARGRRR